MAGLCREPLFGFESSPGCVNRHLLLSGTARTVRKAWGAVVADRCAGEGAGLLRGQQAGSRGGRSRPRDQGAPPPAEQHKADIKALQSQISQLKVPL